MSPTPIERLLSRALLVPDLDFFPEDAYDDPASTEPFPSGLHETLAAIRAVDDIISEQPGSQGSGPQGPATVLHELCEIVVSQGAVDLNDWVTPQMPGPAAARVLGCVLHLTGAPFDARLWWQYSAGDDRVASYCLYLHHLSCGEDDTAASWLARCKPQPDPEPRGEQTESRTARKLLADADASLHTLLRVLRGLRAAGVVGHGYDGAAAVLDFVPATFASYHRPVDDADWPLRLPGPYFADQIVALLAAVGSRTRSLSAAAEEPPRRLPGTHLHSALESARVEALETPADHVSLRLTRPPQAAEAG